MHIATVYLSGYTNTKPISGHVDFKVDNTTVQVNFSDDECLAIQELCVAAWGRKQAALARSILDGSPALVALEAPKETVEEAEFEEALF